MIAKGRIFNVERYAIHDGPGIRTTVFFKGCPLRCWWCHNPEGQNTKPELTYRQGRCIACGKCIKTCPKGALLLDKESLSLKRQNCNFCGKCASVCPSEALSMVGRKVSIGEVIEEIGKDEVFYEESEGGVTFSGGEPLFQRRFLSGLLDECSRRGIHTVLDTSGYASRNVIDKICDKADLLLYDVKSMNDVVHRKYTGVSNKLILRNLQRLAKKGNDIVVSLPIIPDINDDETNILRTAEFVSSLDNVQNVSLLPYHKAGIDKYTSLGRSYRLKSTRQPSSQGMNQIKETLEKFGLNVKIGGR